jgi:hypothetical protein
LGNEGCIGDWSPGIGDPTILGWLAVVAYFVSAFMCWRTRSAAVRKEERGSARLWSIFSIGLIMLGVNKQLDLQTALTELGKVMAHSQGWYEQRHLVQLVFIGGAALFALAVFAFIVYSARHELKRLQLALVGIAGLGLFVVLRVSLFHRIDRFVDFEVGSHMGIMLELASIMLIILGAVSYRRHHQAGKPNTR